MAPQYAPSLRSRLAPLLLSLQIGFVVIYAFYTEIESHIKEDEEPFSNFYAGEWCTWLQGKGMGWWEVNGEHCMFYSNTKNLM